MRVRAVRLVAVLLTAAYPSFVTSLTGGIPLVLENGQIAQSIGNVVGPSTASLTLHFDF